MLYRDKEWFKEQYKLGNSIENVSKIFNVKIETIRKWERIHGIKLKREVTKRKNHFNEHFFENIDTEEKAYILGFIMADGYVSSNGRTLSIAIAQKDVDILHKINAAMVSSANINIKKHKPENQLVLNLCSVKLVSSLGLYGVVKNKTSTIKFPQIKDFDMYKHFIRGYFDGDGYIGHQQCVITTGSKEFVEGFNNFINTKYSFEPYIRKMGNAYQITFNRRDKDIINYIYKDANIFLSRKYESFLKYWYTA